MGAVGFGPCWAEEPSLRELYDLACATIVRQEAEADELRAEVAMLRAEREIMASEINGYRDEACRESCRDKAAADGGWANI
jgi:cell division protein FtsB